MGWKIYRGPPWSFDVSPYHSGAASDASALLDLDDDVAPILEPLKKLAGLLRAGDGLTVHSQDGVTTSQPYFSENAFRANVRDGKSGALVAFEVW